MSSLHSNYEYPYFPSPPSHYTPPIAPKNPPPPPPAPKLAPPPPTPAVHPPPAPVQPLPPPSPIIPPTPPTPSPHHTVIIVVFASLGGLFFLAFAAGAFFCCIKKKKKKEEKASEVVNVEDRVHVHEILVEGPHGQQVVALAIDEDVRVQEQIKKDKLVEECSKFKAVGEQPVSLESGNTKSGQNNNKPLNIEPKS